MNVLVCGQIHIFWFWPALILMQIVLGCLNGERMLDIENYICFLNLQPFREFVSDQYDLTLVRFCKVSW